MGEGGLVTRVYPSDPIRAEKFNQLVTAANRVFQMTGTKGASINGNTIAFKTPLDLPYTSTQISSFTRSEVNSFTFGDLVVVKGCVMAEIEDAAQLVLDVDLFDVEQSEPTGNQYAIVNASMKSQNSEGSVFIDGLVMAKGKRPEDSSTDIQDRFIGANPVSGETYLELTTGPGVFEVITEEDADDLEEEHMIVIRLGRSPLPMLYEAVTNVADNLIDGKRVKGSGEVVGGVDTFHAIED